MPGMLCKIRVWLDKYAVVDADCGGLSLPTEFPADVLRKLKLRKGSQFVWCPPDDHSEEVKPEHILLKWTERDLLYQPIESLRQTKKQAAAHRKAKEQRRYMVILHWGRHEDTEMPGLILALNAPKGGEPRTILQKFVEECGKGYREIHGDTLVCPNARCGRHEEQIRGAYCSLCGTKGERQSELDQKGELNREHLSKFLWAQVFNNTAVSFPQELIESLKEGGWEVFPRIYAPDVIVTITGLHDYLEGPSHWYNEFGTLEVLRS